MLSYYQHPATHCKNEGLTHMANINDFRRRRLAAAAGNPERESWWRYARWRAARILGGITIGLLITIYLIARFGFSLVQDATEPDRQGPINPNTGRAMYVREDSYNLFRSSDRGGRPRVTQIHNKDFWLNRDVDGVDRPVPDKDLPFEEFWSQLLLSDDTPVPEIPTPIPNHIIYPPEDTPVPEIPTPIPETPVAKPPLH